MSSSHLLLQLQALQQALNQRYRQDPLGMPTWPPPPALTLMQQLQAFAYHNPTLPYTERFTPGDHRADAFTGSPLDMKSGHLPGLTELAPLWKMWGGAGPATSSFPSVLRTPHSGLV